MVAESDALMLRRKRNFQGTPGSSHHERNCLSPYVVHIVLSLLLVRLLRPSLRLMLHPDFWGLVPQSDLLQMRSSKGVGHRRVEGVLAEVANVPARGLVGVGVDFP